MNNNITKKKIIAYLLICSFVVTSVSFSRQVWAAKKVKLNKSKITIIEGQTFKLKVKNTKKKAKWYSSNKAAVKVTSKGVVKGVKTGIAKVYAKIKKKKYKCLVTVISSKVVKKNPTKKPDLKPTLAPVIEPTEGPVAEPTSGPVLEPTAEPTEGPVAEPTSGPVLKPTAEPTEGPVAESTLGPVLEPTAEPTEGPVVEPTIAPTADPTIVPTVEPVVDNEKHAHQLTLSDGKYMYLGETLTALKKTFGEPTRIDPSVNDFVTYIYNPGGDYSKYFQVGIKDDKVVMWFTLGKDFKVDDILEEGEVAKDLATAGWSGSNDFKAHNGSVDSGYAAYMTKDGAALTLAFVDVFDGEKTYGAMAYNKSYTVSYSDYYVMFYQYLYFLDNYTDEAMRAMETEIFEITNAYRVYMGLTPMAWEEKAYRSALKHSRDMADNDYFNHTSPDGMGSGDRMRAEGIIYSGAGENIAAGSGCAIKFAITWIKSYGHRSNILNSTARFLGVGCVIDKTDTIPSTTSPYYTYATQNMWG